LKSSAADAIFFQNDIWWRGKLNIETLLLTKNLKEKDEELNEEHEREVEKYLKEMNRIFFFFGGGGGILSLWIANRTA